MADKKEGPGAHTAVIVLAIPLFLVAAAFGFLAWFASRGGASYRAIKLLASPAAFFAGNLIGFVLLIPFVMTMLMFTGHTHIFHFGAIADVTLWTAVSPYLVWFWGGTKPAHIVWQNYDTWWFTIVAYQLFMWWLAGNRLCKAMAMGFKDSAVAAKAQLEGEHPYSARQNALLHDESYAKAAEKLLNRHTNPLFGAILVALTGTWPHHFYGEAHVRD